MTAAPTLRYETADHVLCSADTPGAIPFVQGGEQPDSTYLYLFDLDSHKPGQDAKGLLDYGLKRIPRELADRLVIIPTKRNGYHIPIRSHKPLTPGKVYDPRTQVHAGELLDQRIDAVDAPLLSTLELLDLVRVWSVPGVFGIADDGEQPATTQRREYLAIGRSLVAGWERIAPGLALRTLDQLCRVKPMLAQKRAELRTNPDRSTAFGRFVQSLMLHARDLGRDTGERCAMVMALAVATGANGKEDEKTYKIEKDTAVLIARILDGAAMQPRADGTIPHWSIPKWYSGEQLPKPPAPAAPAPAERTNHATKRRSVRLAALRRQLEAIEPDAMGRRRFLIENISSAPRRTIQADLKILRDAGEIVTGQLDGNGAPYAILTAQFGGAKPCKKPDKSSSTIVENWGASEIAAESAPTPESDDQPLQCIKVLGAPKASAPNPPAPAPRSAPPVDEWAAADAWLETPHGQRMAAKAQRASVDPELFARVDPIASGRGLPAPAPIETGYTSGECDRWLAAHAVGAQAFGAPKPTPQLPPAPEQYDPLGLIARLKQRSAGPS